MNNLQILEKVETMTSLEIAEITGKRHDNILNDIRDEIEKLEKQGIFTDLIFQVSEYKDSTGRKLPMYILTTEGILQLAARYDAVVRYRLIQAVKTKSHKPVLEDIRLRESELYLKYANSFTNEKYRETMLVLGANKLNGSEVLPLPEIKRKSYTATEIGNIIGINAKRVGSIAKAHNLKTEEYGYWAFDKSRYSNKQVESFRYYENAVNEIRKYI